MISSLRGELLGVEDGRAMLDCGTITYEVLVPASDEAALIQSIGETVLFHTLHYLEGQSQGSSFLPRLIGFARPGDRAFFECLTTVKGLGNRKALRAMRLAPGRIAEAIAQRDLAMLQTLPEIGRRTAERIVAELHDKVDAFRVTDSRPALPDEADGPSVQDAVAMLIQLGESRLQARRLVDRAHAEDESLDTPEALVAAAFHLKEPV